MKDLLIITILFIIIDCVSGIMQAIKNKEINSTKMRNGFFNKSAFFLVIILSILCDYAMRYIDIGLNLHLVKIACGYVITTEIISIIENIGKLNTSILPQKIKDMFFKLKE